MNVKIGSTTYMSREEERHPMTVGGTDQFVLVDETGRPLLQERSNGQTFDVSFKKGANARTRAREIHTLGEGNPEIGVFDKRKAQVVFAA